MSNLLGALGRAVEAARTNNNFCGHPWSGKGPHCVNRACDQHASKCVNHADDLAPPTPTDEGADQ